MKQTESIGKYIQQRLRSKKIEDKAVGDVLHIAPSTASKLYSTELTPERVAKLSVLLNEDIYFDYYKDEDKIGPIVNRRVVELSDKIKQLENSIFDKERLIQIQADLIERLKAENNTSESSE